MALSSLTTALWFSGLAFQAAVVVLLLVKKTWRTFPLFAIYCIAALLQDLALTLFRPSRPVVAYFILYWVCQLVGVLLEFAVAYEIFRNLFEQYATLKRLASLTFYWTLIGLLALGAWVAWSQSSPSRPGLVPAIKVVAEAVLIIELGVLMFLFIFSSAVGLHWRKWLFGIAIGLAVFATVELSGLVVWVHWGPSGTQMFNLAKAGAADLGLLCWLGYLILPERITAAAPIPEKSQLEQWNKALTELIYQ